jgi:DNA-binding transcriptional LysR family regulator
MRSTPLQHLPAFLAVAEHKSFTRAAAALGVSTSALSQAVRALEAQVGQALLARTTRSVSVTEAGQRLLEAAGPPMRQAASAVEAASASPGALIGTLRLAVPGISVEPVVGPMLATFTGRHPGMRLEVTVENRLTDIVAEGIDAGIRLVERVQRDMVAVRLTEAFRFVVVGSPSYFRAHPRPRHPRELERHALVGYRSPTTGALLPWELERMGRVWRVPITGPLLITNHDGLLVEAALQGLGLSYVAESSAAALLRAKKLELVLEDWATQVPGYFLYFPSRSRTSPALRAFIECAPRNLEKLSGRAIEPGPVRDPHGRWRRGGI